MGGLLGFSAPGYDAWFLAWVGLIIPFIVLPKIPSLPQALQAGFGLGLGYHLVYLAWYTSLHPLTWMGFSPVSSGLVMLGTWGFVSLYGAIFFSVLWGLFWYGSQRVNWGGKLIAFPLFWWALEWIWHQTEVGIPWALLGYTQHNLFLFRELSSVVGVSGLSALLVAYNLVGATLLQRLQHLELLKKTFLTLTIGLLPWGLYRASSLLEPPVSLNLPAPVWVLQGNLPIEVIRSAEKLASAAEQTYLQPLQSTSFPSGSLVILPEEGVVYGSASLVSPLNHPTLQTLQKLAQQKRIHLFTGLITEESAQGSSYNSLALLSPNRPFQVIHKQKLVPFGEYTPYLDPVWLNQWLSQWGIAYGLPFQAGKGRPILRAGTLRVGGLICFELVYPELAQAVKHQGATLLLNVSNLGWFHGSELLEKQFVAMGQFRAAETHLPLIIATNTGISAMISATGKILQQTPSSQKAVLTWPLHPNE